MGSWDKAILSHGVFIPLLLYLMHQFPCIVVIVRVLSQRARLCVCMHVYVCVCVCVRVHTHKL